MATSLNGKTIALLVGPEGVERSGGTPESDYAAPVLPGGVVGRSPKASHRRNSAREC
jgi:hypothetical protein